MTHDLVRRLEAATGPDRELDLEIARLQNVVVMRHDQESGLNVEHTYHKYTDSLDSALTLLPGSDWEWSLEYNSGMAYAKLGDPKLYMEGEHKVPAIALCIASLRARMG